MTFKAIDIVRVANDTFLAHWGVTDTLGLMQQLGAIPVPEQGES